jgi:hypothetical protein
VNFFGHAVVAAWQSTHPGFVLGAMLPDFATMIGARVPSVSHVEVRSGIFFHHETDRVFHDAPTFRALQSEARAALRERGLPRPGALAVGHIGVEILLDSALAGDAPTTFAYLEALREGHPNLLGGHIEWTEREHGDGYARLLDALAARGVPDGASDAGMVAWRVARALSSRPRLRLDADGERIVRDWAGEAASLVALRAPALIGEVVKGLESAGARLDTCPLISGTSV